MTAEECSEIRLGDLVDIKHGFAFEGRFFRDEPPGDILLTPGNFRAGGGFSDQKLKYYTGPVPNGFVLAPGDLLVSMTDLSRETGTLGYPALVPTTRTGARWLHNQRLGKIENKPGVPLDKRFLYYLLSGPAYRHEVLASATGTTVKHTSPERISAFRFQLPPLDRQRVIAETLGALDEKVELNRRMNETLEAIAGLIFKSWFPDFHLFRLKGEGTIGPLARPLSDDGRTVKELGSFVWIDRSTVDPRHFPDQIFDLYSIPAYDEGQRPIEQEGREIRSQKFLVAIDSVLVSKLNPRTPRAWLPHAEKDRSAVCSTEFLVLRPRPSITREFLYGLLKSDSFARSFASMATGTTGSHQRVPSQALLSMKVVVPPKGMVDRFSKVVRPLFARQKTGISESTCLTRLRDELLPRLVGGGLNYQHDV
jgi:type I restriction enzyme S subunit